MEVHKVDNVNFASQLHSVVELSMPCDIPDVLGKGSKFHMDLLNPYQILVESRKVDHGKLESYNSTWHIPAKTNGVYLEDMGEAHREARTHIINGEAEFESTSTFHLIVFPKDMPLTNQTFTTNGLAKKRIERHMWTSTYDYSWGDGKDKKTIHKTYRYATLNWLLTIQQDGERNLDFVPKVDEEQRAAEQLASSMGGLGM